MSHTTTINAVEIKSIPALYAAAAELVSKHGVRCVLEEGGTPRAYYPDQQGLGKADYVLRLQDAPYDIGFYSNGKGGYEARTDFWSGKVEGQVGVEACTTDRSAQAKMGKLFQAYNINATIEQARKQGHQVRRVPGKNGAEQLVLTGTFG